MLFQYIILKIIVKTRAEVCKIFYKVIENYKLDFQLVLVGEIDYFYKCLISNFQFPAFNSDENLRKNLIEKGYQQVKKYSWQKMAKETLGAYQEILKI